MNDQPTIEQTDLLRVTVIKKKHASQIRQAYRERPDWTMEDIDVLHEIPEWNALLCRRKDNGHYIIIPIAMYYQVAQIHLEKGKIWSHRQAEIQQQEIVDVGHLRGISLRVARYARPSGKIVQVESILTLPAGPVSTLDTSTLLSGVTCCPTSSRWSH